MFKEIAKGDKMKWKFLMAWAARIGGTRKTKRGLNIYRMSTGKLGKKWGKG